MQVKVRRRGKIFRVIKGDARKVGIHFFPNKNIPSAIFTLYRLAAQAEMEESNTLGLRLTEEEITLCKFLEVKWELLGSSSANAIVVYNDYIASK